MQTRSSTAGQIVGSQVRPERVESSVVRVDPQSPAFYDCPGLAYPVQVKLALCMTIELGLVRLHYTQSLLKLIVAN